MEEIFILVIMCLLGSYCIVGIIEWVKAVRDAIIAAVTHTGKISTIAWPILSAAFAAGIGYALGKMPMSIIFATSFNAIIFSSVLMLSFNQTLGCKIIKIVNRIIDRIVNGGTYNQIEQHTTNHGSQ